MKALGILSCFVGSSPYRSMILCPSSIRAPSAASLSAARDLQSAYSFLVSKNNWLHVPHAVEASDQTDTRPATRRARSSNANLPP